MKTVTPKVTLNVTLKVMLQQALLITTALTVYANSASAQILNNSATAETSEDSLTVAVLALDSLGNPTAADSFYLTIFGGGKTNSFVFADSGLSSMTGLDTVRIGGQTLYYYSRKTSDIDGGGSSGIYSGVIIAKSTSLGLQTATRFSFQLVSWELDDIGDSSGMSAVYAKAALDTLDQGFGSLSPVTVAGGAVDSNRTEFGQTGADSTSVARWVWNTPSANHTTAATFGDFLDAKVSSASGGSGSYSVTVIAYDSTNAQTTQGATVAVYNVAQTSLIAIGYSDIFGKALFNLDADSFVVSATLRGYTFPTYDTLVITGTQTDTVRAYPFDPGAPTPAGLVRAWGYVLDISGSPDSGVVVSAFLPAGVTQNNGSIISPFAVSATTDSAGYFALDIIPNANLTPDTTRYEFTIFHSDGVALRKRLIAPDSVSWRITW